MINYMLLLTETKFKAKNKLVLQYYSVCTLRSLHTYNIKKQLTENIIQMITYFYSVSVTNQCKIDINTLTNLPHPHTTPYESI